MAYSFSQPFVNYQNPYQAVPPWQQVQQYPVQQMAPIQQAYQQPMQQQVQPMQPPQPEQPGVLCRPVSSIEEARAVQADFTGALTVLPDVFHGMIHTKQLNFQDGSSIFRTYRYTPEQQEQPIQQEVVPVVQFAPMTVVEALEAKIARLEALLEQGTEKPKLTKGAAKNEHTGD